MTAITAVAKGGIERMDNQFSEQDKAYMRLAKAIVTQALFDWRTQCRITKRGRLSYKLKTGTNFSFREIRRFFKSKWGALVCLHLDPEKILYRLNKERKSIK